MEGEEHEVEKQEEIQEEKPQEEQQEEEKQQEEKQQEVQEEEEPPPIDILEETIGSWGRWQLIVSLFILLANFSASFHAMSAIFQLPKINVTCKTLGIKDPCHEDCVDVHYDKKVFVATLISEFGMICNLEYLKDLTQSVSMGGVMFGALLGGYLGDRFGRQQVISSCIFVQTSAGTICAFCPWYILFIIVKFISMAGVGGQMVISFVLLMEVVGTNQKTILGTLCQIPFNLGHLMLPGIVYFVRHWKYIQVVISVSTIPLFSYFCFLPESPRWLLAHHAEKRAVRELKRASRCNRKRTDHIPGIIHDFMTDIRRRPSQTKNERTMTISILFKSKIMAMYTISNIYNWFGSGLCYFGVAQYVGELGGNLFVNVTISAGISIAGTLFVCYSAAKWGRKASQLFLTSCGALPLLSIIFAPDEPEWVKPALASLSMFGIFGLFTVVYLYAGELFPTKARSIGVGLCSASARLGSIIAPYVKSSASMYTWLPPLVFGLIPVVGFFMTFPLPETKGKPLPNTVEEAEDIYRNRKGFCK